VAVGNRSKLQIVQIHLKKLKWDKFGQGNDGVVGVTGIEICPVSALNQTRCAEGPLNAPLLTKPVFLLPFRDMLQSLGIPAYHVGYCFWIVVAITVAMAGMKDSCWEGSRVQHFFAICELQRLI